MDLANLIVQPFPIHFDCNDYHIILFLKDHPEYEAIEAMIREKQEGPPFIRVILTRYDKTQVDHINDRNTVEMLKGLRKREMVYCPIEYKRSENRGKAYIFMEFTSFRGEEVKLHFTTSSRASVKHCRLIDPLGHSPNLSLPVMYPEKTALAGSKSKAIINGVTYEPPVKIWIPLLYKGMEGFYSEEFSIGVIRSGTERIQTVASPFSLVPGEKWVYGSGAWTTGYEIVSIRDHMMEIRGKDQSVTAEILNEEFCMKKVSAFSTTRDGRQAEFLLEFDPAVPLSFTGGETRESSGKFSISIDKHTSLITGMIKDERDGQRIGLLLEPQHPLWAVSRKVSVVIESKDGFLTLNTGMIP